MGGWMDGWMSELTLAKYKLNLSRVISSKAHGDNIVNYKSCYTNPLLSNIPVGRQKNTIFGICIITNICKKMFLGQFCSFRK